MQNQTENDSDMFENNILIQHDSARRPSTLTRNQTKYLIHLGPCQPKLSVYHSLKHGLMITLTWSTVFRKTKLTALCAVCLEKKATREEDQRMSGLKVLMIGPR